MARFSVLLGPGPQASAIGEWLLKRGFERHEGHMLMLRDARARVPGANAGCRVVRATPRHAPAIARILEETFGLPVSRRGWAMAAIEKRTYDYFVAMVGRTPVGVGAARVDGSLAWLGAGATLTRWRRHGVHAALIAARLRSAARRGCRWAWVETAMPVAGRAGGSRRNLLRLGFEEVCEKPSFVWGKGGPDLA